MKKQLLALMALVATGNVFAGYHAQISNTTGGYILAQLYNTHYGATSPQKVIADKATATINNDGDDCFWGIRVWKCDANGNNRATDSNGKIWFQNPTSSGCGSMDNVQVTATLAGQLVSGNSSYATQPCSDC